MKTKSINTPKKHSINKRKVILMEQLNSLMPFCNGTIHEEFRTCGKPHCKCQDDKSKRHGPYYVWTTKENNKIKRYTLRLKQAEYINTGIARYAAFKKWTNDFEQAMKFEYLSAAEWKKTDLTEKKTKSSKKKTSNFMKPNVGMKRGKRDVNIMKK